MAFIPTAGAVRVDIQFVRAGQQIHNVIWCSRDSAWTQAQREGLAEAIETWFSTTGKTAMTSDCSLTQITVVNQDTVNAPGTVYVVSPAIAGTGGASSPTANSVAMCATLRTDLRGRSYRGRMYLGAVPTSLVSDSLTVLTTYITNALSVLAALKTAIEALGAVWVVVSHFTNKLPRAGGLKTPITAIAMDQYIDSQRRRLGGRGV